MQSKIIKIIVGLVLLGAIYHYFGQDIQQFFQPKKAVVTSNSTLSDQHGAGDGGHDASSQSIAQPQASHLSQIGCMKTETSCACYDQKGKKVDIDTKQCLSYVRDSSGRSY